MYHDGFYIKGDGEDDGEGGVNGEDIAEDDGDGEDGG